MSADEADAAGEEKSTEVDGILGSVESLGLSRRGALAGMAGVGLLGAGSGTAGGSSVYQWGSDPDPTLCPEGNLEHWSRGRNAREYALYNLCGIELVDSPIVTKFDGNGLSVDDDGNLAFNGGDIEGRYTDWDGSDESLNFTGAAEWSDQVNSDEYDTVTNSASGADSVVAGGRSNTTSADGATVPGGQGNTASGNYSFAAGDGATASGAGTFVWSDTNEADVSSSTAGEVRFQASGGFAVQNGDVTVEGGNALNADSVSDATGDNLTLSGSSDVELGGSDLDANGNEVTDSGQNLTLSGSSAVELGGSDLDANGNEVTDSGQNLTLSGSPDVELGAELDTNGNALKDSDDDQVLVTSDVRIEGDVQVTGTKNFIQAVEEQAGPRNIAYTAVEAGKVRTEATDVADLEDGRVEIDLPDHFGMVTSNEEQLCVQITPFAHEPVQPQVVERNLDRIVIEDFGDGPDEYAISYTVKGVREGFEDTAVVRDT